MKSYEAVLRIHHLQNTTCEQAVNEVPAAGPHNGAAGPHNGAADHEKLG